jgi:zinc transport system substrate-binding protein
MNKTTLLTLLGSITLIGVTAIAWTLRPTPSETNSTPPTPETQLSIVTTLFPQYDFARSIAPNADVRLILPSGIDPHSYEPTPQDVQIIQNADLFLYTSDIMEPWVKDLITNIPQEKVVDLSANITHLKNSEPHAHPDEHGHSDDDHHEETEPATSDHSHEETEYDPHYWLDFDNATTMIRAISGKLEQIDPDNSLTYINNSTTLITNLNTLDATYQTKLSNCQQNTMIIAGHSAFGYLTHRYGLIQEAAQDFSPNAEPTSTRVVELIRLIQDSGSTSVFSEELLSDRLAQTIAGETGAEILQISPAANLTREDLDANISFIDIMNSNLESISTGLSCKS